MVFPFIDGPKGFPFLTSKFAPFYIHTLFKTRSFIRCSDLIFLYPIDDFHTDRKPSRRESVVDVKFHPTSVTQFCSVNSNKTLYYWDTRDPQYQNVR